ncbi:anionic trypsin-2-like [Anopheles ziemanni]|uniref:anionic trypsin-2-like n=1 Tax=Anopheles coustani TaxID=139045 RepID=UPI002659A838|nr:anionic trypsin-2-like [Anopheles coustani]XP_058168784.1 anionic trypsin-2-like [Anopheles ziemanni]
MQKLVLIGVLLAVAQAAPDGGPRVTGGALTVPGQFPSAVIIETPYIAQNCMGTVVNRQHVLTAASCVMNPTTFAMINPFWLRVIAGDINIVQPTIRREVRNVSRSYVHPNYNRLTDGNNLAVLRVDLPFSEFHNTIEPALMNERLLPDNTQCEFAGWGATANQVTAAVRPAQYVITQPLLTTAQCNAANVHNNRVQQTMVCAGALAQNPNAVCLGNMGGGLYCNGRLTGVLAFGMGCGVANQPGVYMDVRQYAQWIQQQFTRTDNPPPGWVPPQPL